MLITHMRLFSSTLHIQPTFIFVMRIILFLFVVFLFAPVLVFETFLNCHTVTTLCSLVYFQYNPSSFPQPSMLFVYFIHNFSTFLIVIQPPLFAVLFLFNTSLVFLFYGLLCLSCISFIIFHLYLNFSFIILL